MSLNHCCAGASRNASEIILLCSRLCSNTIYKMKDSLLKTHLFTLEKGDMREGWFGFYSLTAGPEEEAAPQRASPKLALSRPRTHPMAAANTSTAAGGREALGRQQGGCEGESSRGRCSPSAQPSPAPRRGTPGAVPAGAPRARGGRRGHFKRQIAKKPLPQPPVAATPAPQLIG